MISSSLRYIFLYQVWLFTRPKFSRKFIQRADVLHTVCLPAFLRFVQNVWKANAGIFFLVYSACMNFFSLNFPLHEFFFLLSPPPPPPTPITFLMVRPLVSAPGANYYNGCQTSNVWRRNMSRSRENSCAGHGNNRQKQPSQHAREL